MKKVLNIIAFLLMSVIVACGAKESKSEEPVVEKQKLELIPNSEIYRIARQVPSPVELATLIKQNDMVFNASLLTFDEAYLRYENKYNQALNLGVYCADLGYINVYGKYALAIDYIQGVRNLSDDLRVGHFFDFNTLQRLAENRREVDSILYISVDSYDKMSAFLKDQGRDDINALLVLGGWVEAMYITTQIFKKHPIKELRDRIGEQKVLIEDLYKMSNSFKTIPEYSGLVTNFDRLNELYKGVKIVNEAPKRIKNDLGDVLEVIDQNESKIELSDKDIFAITNQVSELRNYIVK